MADGTLPPHVRALRRGEAYPRPPDRVELIQTHISYVFLAGDDVYKLKKPVDLGFVDFTTLEKRRFDCEEEVRLNQRGCPGGVYRGVVPVTRTNGRYRIGGDGEVVDYAVHMKRLPQDRMMDVLLEQDRVDFDMVGMVAGRLADLHRQAASGPEIARRGGTATLRRNWRETLGGTAPFIGRTLSRERFERIEAFVWSFVESEDALLRGREREGWIRECHGDLRSDAVCFDPSVPGGICIFDCIEFNEDFRFSDTGLDAAFLAMDLDYRGRPDLSDLFVGLYAVAAADKRLPLLLDFYKCYRAVVRGRVESLLLDDAGVSAAQKTKARRRARAYFKLAEQYARRKRRRSLVLVTGPSGSGKSVLAGALAARLGSVVLATDLVRRELFGERGRGEPLDTGKYAPDARERVYEEVARQAAGFLDEGRPVLVDGTYLERRQREPAVALARERHVPLLLIECVAPDEVVSERQERREGEAWTASEGRYEVYLAQKQRREPADELPESERLTVDTTRPLTEQLEAALEKLGARN